MTDNKRRIDACLKACEGISTQNLEDNVPFIELARRYNAVLRERDALRAALTPLVENSSTSPGDRPCCGDWEATEAKP